jgi:hypothetical protein
VRPRQRLTESWAVGSSGRIVTGVRAVLLSWKAMTMSDGKVELCWVLFAGCTSWAEATAQKINGIRKARLRIAIRSLE